METILCIDPGKVNMGYGVILHKDGKYKVLKRGMLSNTIKDLKPSNLKSDILKFNKEIENLIETFNVKTVSMERFVSRGLLGSLSEYICIMQGIIAINPKIKVFNLIIASTWKNSFNKHYKLNQFYKEASKLKIKNHEIDAVMIGLYFLSKGKFFQKFASKNHRDKFLEKLQRKL